MFSTLLVETAVTWWTTELTNDVRSMLHSDGLAAMMRVLRRRFIPDRSTAMASFNKGKLRLQDVAADPDATNQYIQHMLQYARDISTFTADRSNWHGVMTTIWGSINREIRLVLKAPEDHKNLADFIKRVEQAKYLIASFARDPAPGRTPYASRRRESYPSRPAYAERSHNSQPFQRCDDKVYNVRFPSRAHKKDADGKGKGIDRTSQNKP